MNVFKSARFIMKAKDQSDEKFLTRRPFMLTRDYLLMSIMVGVLFFSWVPASMAQAGRSSYAGEESRDIKALSPDRIRGLMAGEGLGYAKAAELNQYPGPRHVLDMGKQLKLSAKQKTEIEAIFSDMQTRAIGLGKKIIDREKTLNRLFSDKKIQSAALKTLTLEIGQLEGRLRGIHLEAHLKTTALLTSEQVADYDRLRGYHMEGRGKDKRGAGHDPASMHQGPYKGHEAYHGKGEHGEGSHSPGQMGQGKK